MPEGRLDSTNAREFKALALGHIEGGEKGIIVDFSNLDYISSAGIRVVEIASRTLEKSGGRFTLCAMSDSVSRVFHITGFDRIIAVVDTLEQALARAAQS